MCLMTTCIIIIYFYTGPRVPSSTPCMTFVRDSTRGDHESMKIIINLKNICIYLLSSCCFLLLLLQKQTKN